MTNKFGTFDEYPQQSLPGAEAGLITVWRSLPRFQSDLVLVGGLAIHYLTKPNVPGLPGAVTMDVDLGISLTADGDQYGTIKSNLNGLGFKSEGSRLVLNHKEMNLYVDFLTDDPSQTCGSERVNDVVASIIPGVNRALACNRQIVVSGHDLFGAGHTCSVTVAEIGPMLVMKLNAFGGPNGRRATKDAYDILLGVIGYLDGPEKAIKAFQAEGKATSLTFDTAVQVLRRDFSEMNQDGPLRAASFYPGNRDRIQQDMLTVGRMLLEG